MDVLKERGKAYGSFSDNAYASQAIKNAIYSNTKRGLGAEEREALDLIATKIARIITGAPDHVDNWVDIAGYATLMIDIAKNGTDTRKVAKTFAPISVNAVGDKK